MSIRSYIFSIIMVILSSMFGGKDLVAQINTEKFRRHETKEGFLFNANFRFGYSGGNSEYISIDGTFRADYHIKKNNFFLITNYDYKETNLEKIVNKGFAHLRAIHNLTSILSLEFFVQQEFNEFILLEDRKLLGSGGRLKMLDFQSKNDTLTGLISYLGIGGMFERNIYDTREGDALESRDESFRITSYLTFDWAITNRIDLWAVAYYQPNISYFRDFRWMAETGMEIWIIGKLFFTIDVSYKYNNMPVGDVKNYDLVIKNGLRFSFP